MIKISGKVEKSNTYNCFSCDYSFIMQRKREISLLNPL